MNVANAHNYLWRVLAGSCLLLAGACDPCGPPAEPLIDVSVVLAAPPRNGENVYMEMLDGSGEQVTITSRPTDLAVDNRIDLLLGACDGTRQASGSFTVRAWSSLDVYGTVVAPQPTDPQDSDVVEVTCTPDDGCFAAHGISLTLAIP